MTQKFHLGDEVATLCIIGKLYTDRCTARTVSVMIFMRITRRSGRPARDKQLRALNPIIQVKITHISVTCMFYKLTTLNRNIDCYWLNTIWEDTIMYKKRYKHLRLGHGRHCSGMKFRSQIRTSEHAPNLIGAPAEVPGTGEGETRLVCWAWSRTGLREKWTPAAASWLLYPPILTSSKANERKANAFGTV